MLVDPEAAREAREEDRGLIPTAARRTTECPYCLALILPGDAIAVADRPPFKYAHIACAEFERDLAADPHGTRLREEAEWRRRTHGDHPKPVRVPPARKRKARSAAA